jgi:hypothetical protein
MNINKLFFITLLVICITTDGISQSFSQRPIQLKNATILPIANIEDWVSQHNVSSPQYVLLCFSGTLNDYHKSILKEQNIVLQDYVAANTFTAVINKPVQMAALSPTPLYSIVDIKAEWKYEIGLDNKIAGNVNKLSDLIISVNKGVAEGIVATYINNIGGRILKGSLPAINTYKISIPGAKFQQLVNWFGVAYVSLLTEDIPLNIEAKAATRANLAAYNGAGGYGLTGEGVTIGVGDNTSGQFHVDLKDRIINYNPVGYTNHGVHINGIVGGAAIIDPKGEGHAPHATLVDHLYSNVWEQTPEMYAAHNMTVTNNSYAAIVGDCKYAGTYDVNSRALDIMSSQYDEVLHVFAAGNDGYLNCSPYPAGFATVNGGYQPAKNNIVVTSTDKRYVNASDGGRGPVKDGRLKPEMAAVGVNVNSTTRSEEYLVAGGTSMACPEVAGALGLLTERYKQLKGNVNPKAVLMKAIMLNGTMDLGNPGPDYRFGFGFMDVWRSLAMLNTNAYTTNTVSNNGEQTFTIAVPANVAELKVMLCWHDLEGSPMAATQLINDLDLEVQEPAAIVHYPLILDPTPANMNNDAMEGIDRLNNSEQVTIYNPQAGTYTVKVKGHNVISGSQFYAVAYDMVPSDLLLSFPNTAAPVMAGDSMRAYWFIAGKNNNPSETFKLEFSTDDGQNWTIIDNNIPSENRMHTWFVPEGINSGKCRMKISRNNTAYTNTSGRFIVNTQPVAKLDEVQCPGYIRFNWDAIPNASGYKVFRKYGAYMQEMATTNSTSYTFSGLSPDSFYYVAVCPVIDGLNGYRSIAIKRKPDDGSCAGDISDGDMAISMLTTMTGRKFTSTELSSSEPITVEVQNLDDVAVNHYKLSYSINNAPWQSQDYNTPIPAIGKMSYTLGSINMANEGAYSIKIAVQNLLVNDPVTNNDSVSKTIRQLKNPPVDISSGFIDDFETMGIVNTINDSMGISGNEHWDYHNSDTGHLRSYVNPSITISGNRSISMDAYKNLTKGGNQNELTGTFNFSNYHAVNDEIRMEFDYVLHGNPKFKKGNEVWIRGNDTAEWQSIYTYETGYANVGRLKNSGTLSLTDGLQKIIQDYSSSFQVNFGQHDSSLIAARDFGNGVTFDNVKFYTVQNDAQLIALVSPRATECGVTQASPIVITIRNGVNQTLNNVNLYYRLDNGAIVNEILPSIQGKKQMEYTFLQKADLSASGTHILSIWISADGDTYRNNDSILNLTIHNQPLVISYPYLENFETNNGYWYSEGVNSSWEYGMPSSPKVNKAYSGNNVWKTNLSGNYNNNESGYLYSPCFDISKLQNPLLRFKMAMDIENCGMVLCDMAFMEYSFNGEAWERLGAPHQGTNWYNDSAYIWTEQDKPNWREAITALPKGNILRLRYAFISDPGATFEGLALDDIEVLDQEYYTRNEVVKIYPNPTSDGNIHIEWTAAGKPEMEIAMTDVSGKLVYKTVLQGVNGYNKSLLTTPHFFPGVYFMRIRIGDGRMEYKMVYL